MHKKEHHEKEMRHHEMRHEHHMHHSGRAMMKKPGMHHEKCCYPAATIKYGGEMGMMPHKPHVK